MRTAPDRLDRPFADDLARRIFPRLATGIRWGLERTLGALHDLGDPHLGYPIVHVGGTNGKGSVASTAASVLNRSGLRCGLYTSPQLCSFRERFMVGGEPVGEGELLESAEEVTPVVEELGLTFFEAYTVLAFHLFRRLGVDVAVVEVGLGGRLDATNVVMPEVCVITNVALDHAAYLGESLAEIAREKAGIIKPGVPVVTAETDPDIVAILREVARDRGAPFTAIHAEGALRDVEVAADHTAFTVDRGPWGSLRLRTPLVGRHQASNAALAVATVARLPTDLRPDAASVREGVAGVRWPGRDQIEVLDGVTWVFDVAHNTAGVASLVDTLDRLELPRPRAAVIGVLGDKEWKAMLPQLLRRLDRAWLTLPPSAPPERRWDPSEVAAELGRPTCHLHVDEDFRRSMARARDSVGGGTVVVTGSVHTVGSALTVLGLEPFDGGG